jgi:energy-coupling factor transporter ATP-binding protein EcfA2
MSSHALGVLADEHAFEPARRYAELAADHLSLQELTGQNLEDEVVRAIAELDCCAAIIGPSGSGKSSLIAAVASLLPADRPALRIPVATLRAAAEDNVEFLRHLLLEIRRLLDDRLDRKDRFRLDGAARTKSTRTRAEGGVRAAFRLPPIKGLGIELAGQLRSATEGVEREQTVSDLRIMFDGLLRLFASGGLSPVLVFEDTDQWLGRDDRGEATASAFFSGPVRMLAREMEVSAIIALHPDHGSLHAYRSLRDSLSEHRLPLLRPPRKALERILAHRAVCAGVSEPIGELLTGDAFVRLESEYDRDQNLRRTLLIAHQAVLCSGPPYPDCLDVDIVRDAANDILGPP